MLQISTKYPVLPIGSKVLAVESYGNSVWTQTGRVTVELSNGDIKQYFLKVIKDFIILEQPHLY